MEASQVVLLVTEKPSFECDVRTALQQCGYTVATVSTARDAIDYLGNDRSVQLALLDLELPDINGVELADILRSCCKRLHIRFVATPACGEMALFREFASVDTIVSAVADLLPPRQETGGAQ